MKLATLLAAAGICTAVASSAPAADVPSPARPAPVPAANARPLGPPLDSICNACGVVMAVRTDQQKVNPPPNSGPSPVTGALAGGAIGYVAGRGRPGPTTLGAVAGAVSADEAAKRNAAPRVITKWTAEVVLKDGTSHSYELDAAPNYKPGDVVRIFNGLPYKMH